MLVYGSATYGHVLWCMVTVLCKGHAGMAIAKRSLSVSLTRARACARMRVAITMPAYVLRGIPSCKHNHCSGFRNGFAYLKKFQQFDIIPLVLCLDGVTLFVRGGTTSPKRTKGHAMTLLVGFFAIQICAAVVMLAAEAL
jgi:hypothetical protein